MHFPGRPAWRALASLALALPAATMAGEIPWGGTLGFGSDNVYRGLSLTAGRPAWLADVHRGLGADWVAGLSASAERFAGQSTGAGLALYLQRGWRLDDDWSLQFGAAHHESPWNRYRTQMRYDEATLTLGWRGRFNIAVAVSPNSAGYYPQRYAERGAAIWFEASVEQPLYGNLGANVGVGRAHYAQGGFPDYDYASAGLRYGAGSAYFYLSYLWTDLSGYFYRQTRLTGARWVGSVVWTFP